MTEMPNKTYIILLLITVFTSFAQVGPGKIAKCDRTLWPHEINSNKSFDVASKCEMLVFAKVFNEFNEIPDAELELLIGIKKLNSNSVKIWKEATKKIIIDNFNNLSDDALLEIIAIPKKNTWETISKIAKEDNFPKNLNRWFLPSKKFYEVYLSEQIRLAAYHPRLTSEILELSKAEILGSEFAQKQFLLTFDDGPTPASGNTDKLIKVLNDYKLNGMFFVLGNALNDRLKTSKNLADLYGENLVYSHGKEHKSHQKYENWKESLDFTSQLIDKTFPKQNGKVYFRPPYGQRNQTIFDYLDKSGSKIILWNMDSQDWSANINAQEVADRQIKLMLLWRKGILLFHDVHPKAQIAVPIIYDFFKNCGIVWINPKTL